MAELFGPHWGLLIWPHHTIAEKLKFGVCYFQGGTFLVRRCVNTQSHNQESIDIFIRNHRIRVHEGKTVCSCTLCGKSFRGRDGLTYHMSNVHGEAKKELCELCKKEYSSKNALRGHISRVHERNKVCYCYCGHSFSDNSGLKYHMNHYHQQVAKVACNECGKSLPKPSLRRHLRNIHEGKSNLQ